MPVSAEAGDTVMLYPENDSPMPDESSIYFSQDEEAAFTVTLSEPGVYSYVLTNGRASYEAVITVFWEEGSLRGVLGYYEAGSSLKMESAVFSGPPQEEDTVYQKADIIRTGDGTDIGGLIVLGVSGAVLLGIAMKAGPGKGRHRHV
ncbi:MAG: hypothetical protein K5637_07800 [Lachnospiraceae bacterium]|nr:hypothetical protein [Lachnospiraceae bacterium]